MGPSYVPPLNQPATNKPPPFGPPKKTLNLKNTSKMNMTLKIAGLTTVAKGKNFLTRIWKLVLFRKSYFASINWSKLVTLGILLLSCNS